MASSSSPHPESERRQATVMFADISGFTAMSEKMDPEDVTNTMNELFGRLGDIIEEHGGTVDKFIGDCMMAIFGVPTAIENASVQALHSAVAIRTCVREFAADSGFQYPLDVHIGINAGEVIAGTIGSAQKREYTVMGDTVNLASRLEDQSDAGQILVSASTYNSTRNHFDFTELPPLNLKGIERQVPVYQVESKSSKAYGEKESSSSKIVASALVGREEELNRLELSVFKLLSGEGGIINVVGEAGVGKSRLLAELRQKAEMSKVTLLEGNAISMGRSLSYYPLIDMLKRFAGISDEDTGMEAFDKLERRIRRLLDEDSDDILPFITTMMQIPLPKAYRERIEAFEKEALPSFIVSGVKSLFRALSAERPLILLYDDMQWADDSSIEMLETLMKMTISHPMLLILVMRPRYWETSDKLVQLSESQIPGEVESLQLGSLSESLSKTLLRNLLHDSMLPPDFIGNVVEKSEGNPFFIEEVVRSLIDSGSIEWTKEGFAISTGMKNMNIPASIQDIIMSRVDRLDTQTRDLVKAAAVVGRSFLVRVLEQIAKQVEEIDEKLLYLTSIQIIRQRQNVQEMEYVFKHALAHEAIYQSILLQTRKTLHRSVAHVIETVYGERLHEFYGMLAYHFSRAEDLDKSEEYLTKAGEAALQSAASTEALHYYHEALNLYRNKFGGGIDPYKLARLERDTAQAYYYRGLYRETVEHLSNALEHLGHRLPKSPQSSFFISIANVVFVFLSFVLPRWMRKENPADREIFTCETMVQLAAASSMVSPRHWHYGGFLALKKLARYPTNAIPQLKRILLGIPVSLAFSGANNGLKNFIFSKISALINRDDKKEVLTFKFGTLVHRYFGGTWDIEINADSLDEAIRFGEFQTANCYFLWLGLMWVDMGRLEQCKVLIGKLEGISSKFENQESLLHKNIIQGYYWLKLSEFSKAKAELVSAAAICDKTGLVVLKHFSLSLLLEAHVDLGEVEDAKRVESELESISKTIDDIFIFSRGRHTLSGFKAGLALINQSQNGSATSACKKRLKDLVTAAKKIAPIRVEAYRNIAKYFLVVGKIRKSEDWWRRSIHTAERLGAKLELARTYLELAQCGAASVAMMDSFSSRDLTEYLEDACSIFEQIGSETNLRACSILQQKLN